MHSGGSCLFRVDVQCQVNFAPFRMLQASDRTYKCQPKLITSHYSIKQNHVEIVVFNNEIN